MKHFKSYVQALVAVIICESVGILGALSMTDALPAWYITLTKPVFNPPNWVFGPAWTLLYAMMGISVFLIWRTSKPFATRVRQTLGSKKVDARKEALTRFGVQLFLNAIWTPIFFGLQRPDIAFIIITMLWVSIIWTYISFERISKVAAYLLLPYLAWVTFATYLNGAIWILN